MALIERYFDSSHVGGTESGTIDNPYHNFSDFTADRQDLVSSRDVYRLYTKSHVFTLANNSIGNGADGWVTSATNRIEIVAWPGQANQLVDGNDVIWDL